MSDFNLALPVVLKNEGMCTYNKNDKGGETCFGISAKFLQSINYKNKDSITITDVSSLTDTDISKIYRTYFWEANRCSEIKSQDIANKIFDMCVNMGNENACILAQKACIRAQDGTYLKLDGVIGSKTLAIINEINPIKLIASLRSECAAYYTKITENNPSQKVFLNGWLKRAYQ